MTKFGFNQTHLMTVLTDSKCRIKWNLVDRIIGEIPEVRRANMRVMGGTEANFWNIQMKGYSAQEANNKFERCGVSAFDLFIEVSKVIGWSVMPVWNLLDIYDKQKDSSRAMMSNIAMTNKLLDAGINVSYIELGNELNIWMDIKGDKDYNKNPTEYDSEIKYMADISANMLDISNRNYPDTKVAGIYCRDLNSRDRAWQQQFKDIPFDGLVIHWYESSSNRKDWMANIVDIKKQCTDAGKECLITEFGWNLGPSTRSAAYRKNFDSPLREEYNKVSWELMEEAGVDVACYHRICGTGGHGYNYLQF